MKILRGIHKKINFFFFLCYAFTLSMALNHVFKSQNVKLWRRRWLQNDYSLSLAPSYMKSASIFFHFKMLNLNAPLWKFQCIQNCEKLLIFFLQCYAIFFLYFYFIFPSSTSISIRLSRGILLQYCSAYRNSILILKFPFSCCCLHIFHFIYVVNFCSFFIVQIFYGKNFSLTKWHAIAKINLQFHNFIVIHST